MSRAWGLEFSEAFAKTERCAVGGWFFGLNQLYALVATFHDPKVFLAGSIAIANHPFPPLAGRWDGCVVVWSLVKTLMRYD